MHGAWPRGYAQKGDPHCMHLSPHSDELSDFQREIGQHLTQEKYPAILHQLKAPAEPGMLVAKSIEEIPPGSTLQGSCIAEAQGGWARHHVFRATISQQQVKHS